MNPKTVIIVDDESDARLLLRQYMEAHDGFEVISECADGAHAISEIDRMRPDVVFLDIQMPVYSGFQVIRQLIHIPRIIFTTAYDRYAIEAFDNNAIDYLLKPYTRERFDKAIVKLQLQSWPEEEIRSRVKAMTPPEMPTTRIFVQNGTRIMPLNLADVVYIEADKDYSRFYTAESSFLSNHGISQLEQRLPAGMFLRIHRSFIININHIKELHRETSGGYIITSDDRTVSISRTHMPKLKKFIY